MNKIKNEKELVNDLECSDLCFIKDKVKDKDLAEDKIHDDKCIC